jgi:hypothetical protein
MNMQTFNNVVIVDLRKLVMKLWWKDAFRQQVKNLALNSKLPTFVPEILKDCPDLYSFFFNFKVF